MCVYYLKQFRKKSFTSPGAGVEIHCDFFFNLRTENQAQISVQKAELSL